MDGRRSFVRFALFGVLGLAFDASLLWLLVTFTPCAQALAVTLAFAVTYLLNFFLNRRFSFAAEGAVGAQLARFVPQVGLDYLLTLTVVETLTGCAVTLLLARVLAGGTNAAVNYTMYRWWTFRRRPAAGEPEPALQHRSHPGEEDQGRSGIVRSGRSCHDRA
jgi:putative flippase GtrA